MRAACCTTPVTRSSRSSTTSRSMPPGPGEVTIKIEATGVCHSDLHAMNGSLPQPAPFVPGHEGAGIISAVGEGVTDLAVGDHVDRRLVARRAGSATTASSASSRTCA